MSHLIIHTDEVAENEQIIKYSGSVDYRIQINLKDISSKIRNTEIRTENKDQQINEFIEIKFKNPKGTAHLFCDGKAKIIEMNNENDILILSKRLCSLLQKTGYAAHMKECSLDK